MRTPGSARGALGVASRSPGSAAMQPALRRPGREHAGRRGSARDRRPCVPLASLPSEPTAQVGEVEIAERGRALLPGVDEQARHVGGVGPDGVRAASELHGEVRRERLQGVAHLRGQRRRCVRHVGAGVGAHAEIPHAGLVGPSRHPPTVGVRGTGVNPARRHRVRTHPSRTKRTIPASSSRPSAAAASDAVTPAVRAIDSTVAGRRAGTPSRTRRAQRVERVADGHRAGGLVGEVDAQLADRLDHLVGAGDQGRAATQLAVDPARHLGGHRTGHGEDRSTEALGVACGGQRARAQGRLHHDRPSGERGDQTVAHQEAAAVGRRPRRHLGDEQPVAGDAGEECVVARRVGDVDAAGQDRDRRAMGGQRT